MHDACVYLEFAFILFFTTTQYCLWSFSGEIKTQENPQKKQQKKILIITI